MVSKKGQKEYKSEFVPRFVAVIVTIVLTLLVQPLLHNVFFTDHLNHKTVNKIPCRTPSANPRQVCTH